MRHSIKLRPETKLRLKELGSKDETYDEIVTALIDVQEYGENQ